MLMMELPLIGGLCMIDNKLILMELLFIIRMRSDSIDGVMNFYNCTMYRNLTKMNGNSNAALSTYASSLHATYNVYNSIILYTLEADANWDYISLVSNVVSDMDNLQHLLFT